MGIRISRRVSGTGRVHAPLRARLIHRNDTRVANLAHIHNLARFAHRAIPCHR